MLSREDILHQEKLSLLLHAKYNFLSISESQGKVKNAKDSENSRNAGNELFRVKPHSKLIHEDICRHYSQSIAFAPANSEELAMGYGNRSALFFCIKKYRECITDVDRALSITCSNLLKVKLLIRKAECLTILNESPKLVCKEALQILEQFKESDKATYAKKLNQLLVHKNTTVKNGIELSETNSCSDLLNFERSEEIPSATRKVAIQYNKEWGRHVIATEDILPGEIISVQKYLLTHVPTEKKYLTCSYCTVIAYNCIPCDHCIYSVYCSEACLSKAWKEYHQYECVIYQHTPQLGVGIELLRFALSAIHEAGSIEDMKEFILNIENTKDPRIKGFSNGKFDIEQKKILYSLKKCLEENVNYKLKYNLIGEICNCIFLLAKYTNFFGQKTNILEPELLLDEDRLFVTALILRTCYIRELNFDIPLKDKKPSTEIEMAPANTYVELFTSLINHSCLANVMNVKTNDGKNIIFARLPIKKGSQLFKNHVGVDFFVSKKVRQKSLQLRHITCECKACVENWSSITIPSIKELYEFTPSIEQSIILENNKLLHQTDPKQGLSRFRFDIFNQVCHHMALVAEKITPINAEYFVFVIYISEFIDHQFSGNFFEMPAHCK